MEDRIYKLRETKISSWSFFLEFLELLQEEQQMEELPDEFNKTGLQHQFWSWQNKPREEAERWIFSSLTKEDLYLTIINNYIMTNYRENTAQYNNVLNIIMNLV